MSPHPRLALTALLASWTVLSACAGGNGGDSVATSAVGAPTAPAAVGPSITAESHVEDPTRHSPGCGVDGDVESISSDIPGDREQTLMVAEVERSYRLAVPADYDPDVAAPLLVNLHGSGSNGLQASIYGDLPRRATARSMIVAAPDAVSGVWELGDEGADADFLVALLDDLETRYCIDVDRVHMVGFSLGAWKAAVTACSLDGRIASVALLTVEVFPGECEPLSVLAFHGTADTTVPYGPGGAAVDSSATPNAGLPGALENIAKWADSADCDANPTVRRVGDDVEVRSHNGCVEGVDVALYTIEGGGHTWPGSEVILGEPELTTDTIDATALVLDWFETHPRRP